MSKKNSEPTKDELCKRYLAALLVRERDRAGISQAELAYRLGREQSTIARLERGQRRMTVCDLLIFADTLGFDPARIIRRLREQL
jgi:transcriptional regulator with XRE-family HTH domain